ncbi:MAG TPA: trypsin-like peptidase domain-containing protein [Pseudobacteroides sp.]|uniref:S1C family serine protease n=1 Tax=Pseudobacteroides sp. TaxID=1968840 RepID=UPI002F926B8C
MLSNKNSKKTILYILISTAVLSTLVIALLANLYRQPPKSTAPQINNNSGIPQPQLLSAGIESGMTIAEAVAKSSIPGVVGLSVLKLEGNSIFDGNTSEKWGVGSGVIAHPNGYIITNNHVAGGKSKRIIVNLSDGRNVDGTTVWSDPVLDLAVVKISLKGLPTIPLGDANTVQIGQPAVAIGNPLGLQLQRTVTSGIISALNRTIKIETEEGTNYMEDLIQTDASINPGNSGGPLLNSRGEVIGINTIKVTSAEAIGFAVPINVVIPIIDKLVKKGQFSEPYMGVFAYDKEVVPYIDKNVKIDSGIYISTVDKKSPAFKSGIKECCVIEEVDGHKINTMLQLRTYLYSKEPGDVINVTYCHEGKPVKVPVKLTVKGSSKLLTR